MPSSGATNESTAPAADVDPSPPVNEAAASENRPPIALHGASFASAKSTLARGGTMSPGLPTRSGEDPETQPLLAREAQADVPLPGTPPPRQSGNVRPGRLRRHHPRPEMPLPSSLSSSSPPRSKVRRVLTCGCALLLLLVALAVPLVYYVLVPLAIEAGIETASLELADVRLDQFNDTSIDAVIHATSIVPEASPVEATVEPVWVRFSVGLDFPSKNEAFDVTRRNDDADENDDAGDSDGDGDVLDGHRLTYIADALLPQMTTPAHMTEVERTVALRITPQHEGIRALLKRFMAYQREHRPAKPEGNGTQLYLPSTVRYLARGTPRVRADGYGSWSIRLRTHGNVDLFPAAPRNDTTVPHDGHDDGDVVLPPGNGTARPIPIMDPDAYNITMREFKVLEPPPFADIWPLYMRISFDLVNPLPVAIGALDLDVTAEIYYEGARVARVALPSSNWPLRQGPNDRMHPKRLFVRTFVATHSALSQLAGKYAIGEATIRVQNLKVWPARAEPRLRQFLLRDDVHAAVERDDDLHPQGTTGNDPYRQWRRTLADVALDVKLPLPKDEDNGLASALVSSAFRRMVPRVITRLTHRAFHPWLGA
ncbi:hypothetical protein CXG81DRAFT_18895 [Caulochytrium protostelioides]|uniref:Uncharacterized protein n=1 Tax=Caulochytrium protostelioides TaxID=1555241 RepID=A0A4P9X7T1_9FUNG|nr:hypothetical protein CAUPRSCDRAFT_11026 [Caulochytrium protostelioides]RKP01314.1 hypothetical protein CXG81DRAFT_18895 [Caulochytrium protostelioides]|eukprot:RKP01314.1 hypothetical protein CXG81DRAFT_18895 [Caulochytrium protostelioides]